LFQIFKLQILTISYAGVSTHKFADSTKGMQ